ncbi:TIGR00366 family protein [Mycobacterium sp. 21AC1]|uniref:short-chain fatty acid transporter n=1 Tax=[Mycobacterium] appelbergii TaxID=2939269 RepID=UPI0029390174|nr:TIGR00366 family protein [Mycobacterium sp. 21AC1]MDV3130170.1 TIGR00366 family protein [Mycobacterium sp. 21AC1]
MSQATQNRETFLQRAAGGLSRWSLRWVPDAWVVVVLLTFVVFILTFFLGPGELGLGKAGDLIAGWGDGFWELLEFGMQMAMIMLTGFVVATSPPFRRLLTWVADRPKGPKSAVAVMAATSMILVLINWGLGLIASAVLVRYMAVRQPKVDYRLLVAAAYLGMAGTWHAGLSASAPLLVATPGNFAEQYYGRLIPVSETIFSPFNLVLTLVVIVLWVVMTPLLHPRADRTVPPPAGIAEADELDEESVRAEGPGAATAPARPTPAERIENSRWVNMVIGGIGLIYLVVYFAGLKEGILSGITLNTVNFIFLFVGIILHGTPASLLKQAERGGSFAWGIIIQFPFYAGILGIITATGFSERIAGWFTAIANEHTFPVVTYWYSGLVNLFVPSGGSKFAIEAPYIAEAAQNLGVSPELTVIAYAWGDMATDAIQPFWALPLLAIARLGFRDVMGFLLTLFIAYFVVVSGAFLVAPFFF